MKLYEILNVISKNQKFEIRMIFFNSFDKGEIIAGSPDSVDQSIFRFIHFNEVIGLSTADDVLTIYINQ